MYIPTMKWSIHCILHIKQIFHNQKLWLQQVWPFLQQELGKQEVGLKLPSSLLHDFKDNTNLIADDGRRPGVLDIPGFGVESTRIRDFYPAKYKVAQLIWIWVQWDSSILLPSRPLFSGPKTVQASVTLLEQLPTFLEKSYRYFFLHKKRHEGESIFM